ncbi:pyridoxamine 5'-phosphate oxidase family protein [Kitasatospora aureofaciens]|uniref:pyridoxamine 5'-phosphate oxidase family protein n=1 Tax=Kitasatospora aureofaciens TaxID=1894 RepID=UPI001C47F7E4|nr:pyridoxamine 5'-phosphate oxidase family protein [Kitasatospora aureofaciens]MBV6703026.1 pyridoxamine 5'-phosphate oxidase family protein [Kitasatospora aureofaciens]
MSVEDREEFLAGLHVGILGVDDPRDGGGPLLVPLWYSYRPGGLVTIQTGRETLKARLIRSAGRFSLCAQDESAPYRYVSVEGPVVAVEDPLPPTEREELARRYLDADTATAYLAANHRQLADDILIRMRPWRWRSVDFAAFAREFEQ